jgi:hypothetical protein
VPWGESQSADLGAEMILLCMARDTASNLEWASIFDNMCSK